MSKSPFKNYANAIITIKGIVTGYTTSPTGNRIPNTTDLTFKALLESVTSNSQSIERLAVDIKTYVGGDVATELLAGYLVEPLQFPNSVKLPVNAEVALTMFGKETKGSLYILPVIESPWLSYTKIDYLNRIVGVFKIK